MKHEKNILKNKVQAFTLIEVLMVLVISGTVISLAMWSYLNVSKYLRTYEKQEAINQELLLFLNHFKQDFDQANYITENNGYIQLHNSHQEMIEYDFYAEPLMRYFYEYADTFSLNIINYDILPPPFNENWVEELTITLDVSGREYHVTLIKTYTPQQWFTAYEY